MTTTFETTVKISFELTTTELREIFKALNSAEVAILEKSDECVSSGYQKYYQEVSKTLEDFVANFNPAKFVND